MTILNPTHQPIVCKVNWQDFNFTDEAVSKRSTAFNKIVYKVRNLWTGRMEGKTSLKNKIDRQLTIPAQDVVTYRLYRK